MNKPTRLFKTTIVIWSDFDPESMELCDLARDAYNGGSFCSSQEAEEVTDSSLFPETEFFDWEGSIPVRISAQRWTKC
jgi:hypothetical protein